MRLKNENKAEYQLIVHDGQQEKKLPKGKKRKKESKKNKKNKHIHLFKIIKKDLSVSNPSLKFGNKTHKY